MNKLNEVTFSRHAAKDSSANVSASRMLTLGTVTQFKLHHGVFGRVHGAGFFNPETLSALLTQSEDMDELYAEKDVLKTYLADPAILRNVFKQIWPKMSSRIRIDIPTITVDELYRQLVSDSTQDSPALEAYIEIILHALGSKNLIVPVRGFLYLEERARRIPTASDFIIEAVRMELEDVFRSVSAKVQLKGNDATAEVFLAMLEVALDEVMHQLEATTYAIQKIQMAMAITKAVIVGNISDHAKPAEDVVRSPDLARLMADASWVAAAMKSDYEVSPEQYLHNAAVRFATQVVSSSSRMETLALSDFAASVEITPITDERANISDVVISRSIRLANEVRTGVRAQTSIGSSYVRFLELPEYAEPLARTALPMSKVNPTAFAHEVMAMALDAKFIPEADMVTTTLHALAIAPEEAMPLAAYFADRVYVQAVTNNDDGDLRNDFELIFYKQIDQRRLHFNELPISGEVFTSDPWTLLMCAPVKSATVVEDTSASHIPPELFKHVVQLPEHQWTNRNYGRAANLTVGIGGENISADISLPMLFAQPRRDQVVMLRHLYSEALFGTSVEAILAVTAEVAELQETDQERKRVQLRTAHALNALLAPLMNATAVRQLTDTVFRTLARQSTDRSTRELTYRTLTTDQVAMQIRVWVALMILNRTSLLTNTQRARIETFFSDLEFYDLYATADSERFLKSLSK
jgi:hypothetical protein